VHHISLALLTLQVLSDNDEGISFDEDEETELASIRARKLKVQQLVNHSMNELQKPALQQDHARRCFTHNNIDLNRYVNIWPSFQILPLTNIELKSNN
jgi:hypothetical protein